MNPEPLILADPDLLPLPPGQKFYLDDSVFRLDREGLYVPHYGMREVAKTFFAMTYSQIAWQFKQGRFVLDGQPVGIKRDAYGRHIYTLADVERMAHALGSQAKGFDGRRVRLTMLVVKSIAEMYGYL